MSKKLKIVLVCLLVFSVVFVSVGIRYREELRETFWDWLCGPWENHYELYIGIGSKYNLSNITLYLPVPMLHGNVWSKISEIEIDENWRTEVINTSYGKMLKLTANITEWDSLEIEEYPSKEIITNNPVGNSLTLYPRFNESYVGIERPGVLPETRAYKAYKYGSYIYAKYNTSSENEVSIWIRFHGGKSRANPLGITSVWYGYGYEEKITCTITGSGKGWYNVTGRLLAPDVECEV